MAYRIMTKERLCTDLTTGIELQQLNGIDIRRVLHSDHFCSDIISHIVTEIHCKDVADILFSGGKLLILIDESTLVSCKTADSIDAHSCD